jgi:hypothetical protein
LLAGFSHKLMHPKMATASGFSGSKSNTLVAALTSKMLPSLATITKCTAVNVAPFFAITPMHEVNAKLFGTPLRWQSWPGHEGRVRVPTMQYSELKDFFYGLQPNVSFSYCGRLSWNTNRPIRKANSLCGTARFPIGSIISAPFPEQMFLC